MALPPASLQVPAETLAEVQTGRWKDERVLLSRLESDGVERDVDVQHHGVEGVANRLDGRV